MWFQELVPGIQATMMTLLVAKLVVERDREIGCSSRWLYLAISDF